MYKTVRREGEDLESLMRRWKRDINDNNTLAEIKKHEYFVSRGEKNREAKKKAIQKARKAERMAARRFMDR